MALTARGIIAVLSLQREEILENADDELPGFGVLQNARDLE
jgi:hypothetical protein